MVVVDKLLPGHRLLKTLPDIKDLPAPVSTSNETGFSATITCTTMGSGDFLDVTL